MPYDPLEGMPEAQKSSYVASTAQPTTTYNPSTGMNEYPTGATPAPTGPTRAQAAQDRDASLAYYDRIFNEERARLTQVDAEEKAILGVRLTKKGAVGGVGQGSEEMGAATPFQTTGNRKITDFTSQRVGEAQTRAMAGRNAATQNFQNVLLKMDELDLAKKAEARAQSTFDTQTATQAKESAKKAASELITNFTAGGGTFEAIQGDTENYKKLIDVYGNETALRGAYNTATLLADKDLEWKEVYRADETGNAILHRYAVGTDGTLKTQDLKLGIPYAEVSAGNAKTIDGHIYAQQADGSYKRLDPVTEEEKQKLALVGAQTEAAKANAAESYARAEAARNPIPKAPEVKDFNGTMKSWDGEKWVAVPQDKMKDAKQLEKAGEIVSTIDAIINSDSFGAVVGFPNPFTKWTPGTEAQSVKNKFNTLKGLLTLDNIGVLKGVLSDADMKIIKEASTSLGTNLSEEAFKTEAARIKEKMQLVLDSVSLTNTDETQTVTAPDGQDVIITD